MKRRFTKLFSVTLLLMLFAALAVFAACVDDNPEEEKPTEYDKSFGPYVVEYGKEFGAHFAERIDTLEQMTAFVDEKTRGSEIYNGEIVLLGELPTAVLDKIATFDKKYFEGKSVIAVCRVQTCISYVYFQEMQVDGNVLTITLLDPNSSDVDYADAMTSLLFLIEVDKATVENVTQIDVVVKKVSDY